MPKAYSSREMIRMLEAEGWRLARIRGDHHIFKHPAMPELVTVTHPKRDIPTGTLRGIFRAAGWPWPPRD